MSARHFSPLDSESPPQRSGAGDVLLRLEVTIKVATDTTDSYLRALESQFRCFPEGGRLPVFRYEYNDVMERGSKPAAHFQFHGHHPELESAMMRAGRVQTRSSSKAGGPNVTDLHLPVGGTRFRPCLEDVLEVLIREFEVDPLPDRASAFDALAEGRRRWRSRQLRAAVRDNPEDAVEQLRDMGYEVTWAGEGEAPTPRVDKLRAL